MAPDDAVLEHLHSIAAGGNDQVTNLAMSHNTCNALKGTSYPATARLWAQLEGWGGKDAADTQIIQARLEWWWRGVSHRILNYKTSEQIKAENRQLRDALRQSEAHYKARKAEQERIEKEYYEGLWRV